MCFAGFFPGMSRHDAQALAEFYDLDGEGCYIFAQGEKAVRVIFLDIKSVAKILRRAEIKCETFEEVAQAVANEVGDLQGYTQTYNYGRSSVKCYKREIISGCQFVIDKSGIKIVGGEDTELKDPKESEEGSIARLSAQENIIRNLIDDMVEIPVVSGGVKHMKSFMLGKSEVTQIIWSHIMGKNPSVGYSAQIGIKNSGDLPVESVTWDDCQRFLKELNELPEVKATGLTFRLPTIAEWMYACRSGATRGLCKLSDGTEVTNNDLDKVAWLMTVRRDDIKIRLRPVGLKVSNAFGLYDMIGNVAEWTCSKDKKTRGEYYYCIGGGAGSRINGDECKRLWKSPVCHDSKGGKIGLRLCASKFSDSPKESIPIAEKDMKLKDRILALCSMQPNMLSANKWLELSSEVESKALKQAIFKVAGAALISDKKMKTYKAKVRSQISDVVAFESSLQGQCSVCRGNKTTTGKCSTCSGSGKCKNSRCKNGRCRVYKFSHEGGDRYETCKKCLGTGVCQDCKGERFKNVKCSKCHGNGMVIDSGAASKAYLNLVEIISEMFQ